MAVTDHADATQTELLQLRAAMEAQQQTVAAVQAAHRDEATHHAAAIASLEQARGAAVAALDTTTVELAARIAKYSRLALEATKHQLRQSWHMDLIASMNTSFWGAAALYHGADLPEGVNAALEKREPEYNRLDKENDA